MTCYSFVVDRVSACGSLESPCAGAYELPLPQGYDAECAAFWGIDFLSLESLMAFVQEHGRCVIRPKHGLFDGMGSFTIYDDYLE